MGEKSYGCCACIGAAGVAVMPISAVMAAKDGLRINHLMSGRVDFDGFGIEIKTDYPYGESAEIKIVAAPNKPISLGIRIPEFAKGKMTVNGEIAKSDGYGYNLITKAWSVGEVISVTVPREVRLHELNKKVALTKGVIAFALDERCQDINVKVGGGIVSHKTVKIPFTAREALEVKFEDGGNVLFTDFASAGSEWDKDKNNITVWIDKE